MTKTIKQSIVISADCNRIFDELLLWGESLWWPKRSLMRLKNLSGDIKEGTLYLQKVKLAFGPSWHTKNEAINEKKLYIKRAFLDGLFEGFEELSVSRNKGPCEVVYNLNYKIKGAFNKLMWKLLFKKLHIKNIELILQALKDYLEKHR